jgi:hypothetical protein
MSTPTLLRHQQLSHGRREHVWHLGLRDQSGQEASKIGDLDIMNLAL